MTNEGLRHTSLEAAGFTVKTIEEIDWSKFPVDNPRPEHNCFLCGSSNYSQGTTKDFTFEDPESGVAVLYEGEAPSLNCTYCGTTTLPDFVAHKLAVETLALLPSNTRYRRALGEKVIALEVRVGSQIKGSNRISGNQQNVTDLKP